MTHQITVAIAVASGGLLLAGFGGASLNARADSISVRVRVTTHPATIRKVQSFSLICKPTGGTLPLAGRVCRDISLHPKAMLDPPRRSPGGRSSVCSGSEFMPMQTIFWGMWIGAMTRPYRLESREACPAVRDVSW
jgi:hypothetical protein